MHNGLLEGLGHPEAEHHGRRQQDILRPDQIGVLVDSLGGARRVERDAHDIVGQAGEDHAQGEDKDAAADQVTRAEGGDHDQHLTDKNAEGREAGDGGKTAEKGHEGPGHARGQVARFFDQPAAEPHEDIAGGEKETGFDQAVVDQADDGPIGGHPADAGSQRDDAHVFDAGVGQHAFVLGLLEDEGRRRQDGGQTEDDQDGTGKPGQAGGMHDLVGLENAQVGAIEQDAGEQGRGRAGGLAVGIGQPGVHGGQPHFGPIADQDEHEAGLEPAGIQFIRHAGQRGKGDRRLNMARVHGDRDQNGSQKGHGDADRTDQHVFPGRLQRRCVAVGVDQRRAGQGGGFDGDPHDDDVIRQGDHGHGGQKKQHGTGEDILTLDGRGLEIGAGVDGNEKKEQ
ncbi:hypothetical protein DESC_270031 [Desulfosarcina cetonica]|nr:hypothetical protein DESC_270031 [Desulfosarcina cetonica]